MFGGILRGHVGVRIGMRTCVQRQRQQQRYYYWSFFTRGWGTTTESTPTSTATSTSTPASTSTSSSQDQRQRSTPTTTTTTTTTTSSPESERVSSVRTAATVGGKSKKEKKTMAQMDEELRMAMEGRAGDGGESGLELEDGRPVSMKRGVRENMFRYI